MHILSPILIPANFLGQYTRIYHRQATDMIGGIAMPLGYSNKTPIKFYTIYKYNIR